MSEKMNKLTVLVVEPEKRPYVKEIDSGLESLQHEVGGYIEVVYPFADPVGIVCNEEGKLEGLPLNRALRDEDGYLYDVLAGTFLIVGLTEEDFGSLTQEQIDKFLDYFKNPELFTRINGKIMVTPILEDPDFPDRTLSIYQIKDSIETSRMRFMNYDYLKSFHFSIDSSHYEEVYSGAMRAREGLEDIYARFNLNPPKDYMGHSLSVSDVIVIHEGGKDNAYFVDSIGFKELPDFFTQKELTVNMDTEALEVTGYVGTWHPIDYMVVEGKPFYLMEHDNISQEDCACLIVDEHGKMVLDQVYDSFDEFIVSQLKAEVMTVETVPDPSITIKSMKEYGYTWGGMLPLSTEVAAQLLNSCPIYCLYEDNSEALITSPSELEEHDYCGGIFGIEKTDWIAYQKKSLDKQIQTANQSKETEQPDNKKGREAEPEL